MTRLNPPSIISLSLSLGLSLSLLLSLTHSLSLWLSNLHYFCNIGHWHTTQRLQIWRPTKRASTQKCFHIFPLPPSLLSACLVKKMKSCKTKENRPPPTLYRPPPSKSFIGTPSSSPQSKTPPPFPYKYSLELFYLTLWRAFDPFLIPSLPLDNSTKSPHPQVSHPPLPSVLPLNILILKTKCYLSHPPPPSAWCYMYQIDVHNVLC